MSSCSMQKQAINYNWVKNLDELNERLGEKLGYAI